MSKKQLLTRLDWMFLAGLVVVSLIAVGIWYYFDGDGASVKVNIENVSNRLDVVSNKVDSLERTFNKKFRQLDERLTVIERRLQDGG